MERTKVLKAKALKAITRISLCEARKTANSSCIVFAYQPKLPEAVKKLRKF